MSNIIVGNKVPLYRQLATKIMMRVRTGEYHSGQELPSLRDLSTEYKVSLNAMQRAIRELENEGILSSHQGKRITLTANTSAAERAAILFGLIHPYGGDIAFGRDVFYFAGEIFGSRSNLLVTVSSAGSAAYEREQAQHLIRNGVQGLLIWPVEGDANAGYLEKLSKKIPIILVDRLFPNRDIPAVVHDTHEAGKDICDYFFNQLQRKRLLVIMDDLPISPYLDLVRGMRDYMTHLHRLSDLTVIQLPVSTLIRQFNAADFSQVSHYQEHIERILREGNYDGVFCYQDDFADYVLVESGVLDQFPQIKLGATGSAGINTRSRKFCGLNPTLWRVDHQKAISTAADQLQTWVLSKRPPNGMIRIHLVRNQMQKE